MVLSTKTNNIGEFLAIVHALALMAQKGITDKVIYSDSVNAQLWVKKKQCKTKLEHTPRDRAAPSDHSPRRELAPHPSGYHPYFEMGYQDLGRNPCRLRKEIIEIYCKRMASAGAEAILKLNLTKINTNLLRKSRQTFLIILFHLIPMVIRPNISFYRNVNLLLIMQELH